MKGEFKNMILIDLLELLFIADVDTATITIHYVAKGKEKTFKNNIMYLLDLFNDVSYCDIEFLVVRYRFNKRHNECFIDCCC